ncbi:MAG: prenyltransferase [Eggerthellaceae bacterium]|nr:prenyltransferase [Eggerthellaceae bacterium]
MAFSPLKPRLALQLAAPHTWPASILPVLFASSLVVIDQGSVSVALMATLLGISILMQAAANTLNDYFDYVKGADSLDNQVDPNDAVLVYHNVNPRSVLILAIGFLAAAVAGGVYVIASAGWIPLGIGVLGVVIIVLYSAGKTPLSYLPMGEVASGFAFGGLIPLACYQVLSSAFDLRVLYLTIPLMLGIALIMFTNNTCDREKDIEAGRKTLAVLLGRPRSLKAYHAVLVIWILAIVVLVACFYTAGLIVVPFMLLTLYPTLKALVSNPLTLQARVSAMAACLNTNIGLGAFFIVAMLIGRLAHLVL